jgi:hypothetical protein
VLELLRIVGDALHAAALVDELLGLLGELSEVHRPSPIPYKAIAVPMI